MEDDMTADEFDAAYAAGEDVELVGDPIVVVGDFMDMPLSHPLVRPDLTFGANVEIDVEGQTKFASQMPGAHRVPANA